MKLHYFQGSCALAPHIALEWAGADYELAEMKRSQTRAPEFLAKNPAGKVPVLELDDGTCVSQVNAVLQYIAETWPAAGLGPESNDDGSTDSRHAMQRWLSHFNGDVHTSFTPYFMTHRYADSDAAKAEVKAHAAGEVAFQLGVIEDHMAGRDWMLGDARSILDPYLFVFTVWAGFMPDRLNAFPNLKAFNKRMKEDPGVHNALKMQGMA
ncbi:MAG: glutathione S-transferase N-terminal domain-containing protein [Rhodospirillaceae bacterium]|nr:glutathione S-transferase N-terminal domain-containing protein [Rhodospirillaceae bacterium]MCY4067167.1 glutathione S-transferase N-terminal domain-containing protein [Rhodospirillaceae bacterium]